jgi:tetratricopeptide (TPR) repeat protein
MGKEKIEELSTSDRIAGFLYKNRIPIIVLSVLLLAGILGLAGFFSVRSVLQKNAVVTLEGFEKRLSDLGDLSEPGDASQSAELDALLEEINGFAPKTFGYAAARAYSLAGNIHHARKEWKEAEEAWLNSSQKAGTIYLAPLSLYNAAVAAEEQGDLNKAVEYYNRSLDFPGNFPAAPRARFNIGRIREAQNNREAALEAYRGLIEKTPSNSNWVKLAQSRMIAIGMEN